MKAQGPAVTLFPLFSSRAFDLFLAAISFCIPLVLYLQTLAPGVLDADQGEFQTNIYNLGVGHTGYPLFFMLEKVWTLLVPFGDIAYRANLFSAFVGAGVCALLYGTMRVLFSSRLAALFTSLLFGLSRWEWAQAVIPDVYTLNSFFIVLVILVFLLWRMGRIGLPAAVFVYGLSLTHHRTMIWFAPALLLLIFLKEGRQIFRPRRLVLVLLAFAIPLLLYFYIPLRGDSDVGTEYHPGNITAVLALNAFQDLRLQPAFIWSRVWSTYLPLLIGQFSPLGFAFGLLGILALALNRAPRGWSLNLPPRDLLVLVGVAHLFETGFALAFWVVDSEIFFIPSYLTFLFFIGIGLAHTFGRASSQVEHTGAGIPGALGVGVVGAVLILNLAYLVRENWAAVDLSTSDDAQARWQDIFAQPLEANAVIAGNWESLTPLEYYQYVQGERRDLQKVKLIAYTSQLAQAGNAQKTALARLDAGIRQGHPVYLTLNPAETETLGGWARGYDRMPSGSLWQIFRKTPNAPPMQNALACAQFGDAISLRGYALDGTQVRAGASVRITLYWTARTTLRENYTVFVHLLDANNHVRAQHDSAPRNNQLATMDWIPGVSISDQHQLDLPASAPAGTYQIEIGLYRAEDGRRLAVDECQNALPGDHLILNQTLMVTR